MTERTINARQLAVLRWVVAGCPEGVMTDTSHKVTAKVLQSRALVVVSGRGGTWKASATDAGRHFIEHGEYPPGHWSTRRFQRPRRGTRSSSGEADGRRLARVTGRRPVDQVMADLTNGGGTLTVADPEDGYREGLASSANQYRKVPYGKVLKVERGKTWKERVIRLEDVPAWMTPERETTPVAEELRHPHPVVRALRDDRDRLRMKGETRARALRILDAIAKTCQGRGYEVAAPTAETGYRHSKGCLMITIRGHPNTVDLDELLDRVPHQPTAQELRDKARYDWTRIPTHDQVPSGRLRLRLLTGRAVRQDTFMDTKTVRLEERVPVVQQELELRAAAQDDRDPQIEAEREERRRQWQETRDEAEVAVREDHRAKTLKRQVEQWHWANQIDAYLSAMAERITALEGDEQAAAREWVTCARRYRARLDPLGQTLAMPPDPTFTAEALAPFMRGLSAHEPEGASTRWWRSGLDDV